MTVLFIAASNEGIALSADGLQCFAAGDPCVENGQKIWEGKTLHHESILYGCYGDCAIKNVAGRWFHFSNFSEFALSTIELDSYGCSPERFLVDFTEKVGNELQRFLAGYTVQDSPVKLPSRIATIALAWYSGGKPFCGYVSFTHEEGSVGGNIRCFSKDIDALKVMIGGSQTIYDRGTAPIVGLRDAIAVAKKFAQDCVDNRCVIPDCSEFGGRVHVGVLTESGFYWDVAP